jgi:hypothetical protein
MIDLNEEEQEDHAYILGLTRHAPYKLNLGDPQQYRYALNMLKRTGETPESSPHTFASLAAAHATGTAGPPEFAEYALEDQNQVQPLNTILNFGTEDQVNYVASALSTIPGGTAKTTILLTLVAKSNGQQIGVKPETQYGDGTNFIVTAVGVLPAQLQGSEVVSLATFYVWSNGAAIPTVYTQTADDTASPTTGVLTSPTYTVPGRSSGAIIACWNRTPGSVADCDYWNPTGQPKTFDFPVSGSLTFGSPISTPITGMFILSLQLASGGGAAILSNLNAQDPTLPLPTPAFSVDPNNANKVNWTFPASQFPNTQILPTAGALVKFSCFVSVGLTGSASNTGSGTFTSDNSLWTLPGVFPVPQIDILYGCLAAGTKIRMADGSEMLVEQFDGGGRETVLVGLERTPTPVSGTVKGLEEIPIVVIEDDGGHKLWLTQQHPVPTPGGVVLARDLQPGTEVYTEDGNATLVSVERESYDGEVWNLKIGTPEEAALGLTTIYANGILVGDLNMQRHFGELDRQRRSGNPLDDLPAEWHQDYLNWVSRAGGTNLSTTSFITQRSTLMASGGSQAGLTVFNATYDGHVVSATWEWVPPGPQPFWVPTNYILNVQVAGSQASVNISNNPPVTSGSLPLPFPLIPGWALVIRPQSEGNPSLGLALVFLIVQPVLRSVRYDVTALSVIATWTPPTVTPWPPGARFQLLMQNYTMSILTADGTVIVSKTIQDPVATGSSIQLSAPLAQNGNYRVLISANALFTDTNRPNSTQASGTATAPLLTSVPQLLSVDYDGSNISAVWTPLASTTPPVTSWTLRAYNQGGTIQSISIPLATATSGTLPLQSPLPSNTPVLFEVSAVVAGGVVYSASPSVQILTALLSAKYDGSSIVAIWSPAGNPPVPISQYKLRVTSALTGLSQVALINNAQATNGTLPLLAPFILTDKLIFSLLAINTAGVSSSVSTPVIATQPVIKAVVYQPASVTVEWMPVVNAPVLLSGYSLDVYASDGQRVAHATVNDPAASTGVVPLTQPLAATGAYTVQVSTLSNSMAVSAASERVLLVSVAPSLQSVSYDGQQVSAVWSMGKSYPRVTGFTLIASPAGGSAPVRAAIQNPVATSGKLSAPGLSPQSTFAVIANAEGAASSQSPPATLLVATPSLLAASYTGLLVAATWTPSTASGVTTYTLRVLSASGAIIAQNTINNPSATGGAVTLPAPLPTAEPSFIQVCANAPSGQVCTPQIPLIEAVPHIEALIVDASQVTAIWPPLSGDYAGIAEFDILILDASGAVRFRGRVMDSHATSGSVAITLDQPYVAQISAIASSGVLATGPPVPLLIQPAQITQAVYDGSTIKLTVNASTETGVTGYEYEIANGGTIVARGNSSGQFSGTLVFNIPLVCSANDAYTATVRATGLRVSGPAGTAVSVIAAKPQITQLSYTTATGTNKVSVSWNAEVLKTLNGVTGYLVQLYENGNPLGAAVNISDPATGATDIVPVAALAAWNAYTVTVQAKGAQGFGPQSIEQPCIVSSLRVLEAEINGEQWRLRWQAAPERAVTGYTIKVTDAAGGNAMIFHSAFPEFTAANQFTQNQSQVTISAVGAVASGPEGPAANLYGDDASYYFSLTGTFNPAYLYRASSHPSGSTDITLYLPNLFTQPPSITSDVFLLTKPSNAPARFPYLITVSRTGVAWQFDATSRTALWRSFVQFLKDLDAPVGTGPNATRLLEPRAFNLITQVLGRTLPLMFTEQLGFLYRFNAQSGYIDLVPGMRLRLDAEEYQYVGPPNPGNVYLSGFVGSGTAYFELGEYWQGSQLNLGFNSYLSLCGRPAVLANDNTGGGGGALDFYAPLNRHPLYRLIYPAQFPSGNTSGRADITGNILIIGANFFADLEEATQQYIQNGNFNGYEQKISITRFRGRSVITPEIPVEVNNSIRFVPVGTTVRQLLSTYGGGVYPNAGYLRNFRLERAVNSVVDNLAQTAATPKAVHTNPVRYADAPMSTYSGGVDYFDLPLIHGDALFFSS